MNTRDYSFLLNRPEHVFAEDEINVELAGLNVLVTGAGGSIGSALVRRLYASGANFVGCVGHSEAPIFALRNSLPVHPERIGYAVADVSDWAAMKTLLLAWHPHVIFHAAAHKHVGLMESQPREAFRNNTEATLQLAQQALSSPWVRKFVFISTDKAVKPTCVMGASKRLAEVALLHRCAPFATVCRFGNVLGSAGSLVEIIEGKIARKERLTITDPAMKRFFITAKEAVGLVFSAAFLEEPGNIYTLEMGVPVSIMEILEKMSPRHPLEYDVTNPGSGEKLSEEILNDFEITGDALTPGVIKICSVPNPQVEAALNRVRNFPGTIVKEAALL